MSEQSITANHNFIEDGAFLENLEDFWTINDRAKAIIAVEQWEGVPTRHLRLVNEGTAEQVIQLAALPRPATDKAVYRLGFWYQAIDGAECWVVITPSKGGEQKYILVPSLTDESILESESEEPQELKLQYRLYDVELKHEETKVTIKFTSPANAQPGLARGLRVTRVTVELHLEDLLLESWSVEGKPYMPTETLRLPWGAQGDNGFKFAMRANADSVWNGTNVGLLVDESTEDPEKTISTSPGLGVEQSIDAKWSINCEDGDGEDIERVLHVRSQYTAELYAIRLLLGNYRLNVVSVLEAAYYPVIDFRESVPLSVRVQSHYTKKPMPGCWVTWTLDGEELHREMSDDNGEAHHVYVPPYGDLDYLRLDKVIASVDSHYYPEQATCTLEVRVLSMNPWIWINCNSDGRPVLFGKHMFPSRGRSSQFNLSDGSRYGELEGSEITIIWKDAPDSQSDLGALFKPPLGEWVPISKYMEWDTAYGNKKDGVFELYLKCSKLLKPSPVITAFLGHNWVTKGDVKPATRFPALGSDIPVPLQLQILSRVPGVEEATGVDVVWSSRGIQQTIPTGSYGWSQFDYYPEEEGTFDITATVLTGFMPPDRPIKHDFQVTVLGADPWSGLATLTMQGRGQENTGLVFFRGGNGELEFLPIDSLLIGENIWLAFPEGRPDPGFNFDPPMDDKRRLADDGLRWSVASDSSPSTNFELLVCSEKLDPWTVPCLLVSRVLEEEGRLSLDQLQFDSPDGAFPCLGGKHEFLFLPNHDSPLLGKQVTLQWSGQSCEELGVIVFPEGPQTVESSGVKWTLDCTNSVMSGDFSLTLDFADLSLAYPPIAMSLGHNRLDIVEVREATVDPVMGESVRLGVKVLSYYTQQSVSGLEVFFNDVGAQTREDGWALCDYPAEEVGPQEVSVSPRSPYYGDQFPEPMQLTFETLATSPWLDAKFQLDVGLSDIWGTNTGFPRRGKTHTVKLILNDPKSRLIGREVSLAWTGTSPAELDITVSDAELGVARRLPEDGLSWHFKCGDIKNGSFALQLVASRLLEKSPANAMSLGSTPAIAELSLVANVSQLEFSGR